MAFFFRSLFAILIAACSLGSAGFYILQPFLFKEARLYAGDWSAVWGGLEGGQAGFSGTRVSRDEEQLNGDAATTSRGAGSDTDTETTAAPVEAKGDPEEPSTEIPENENQVAVSKDNPGATEDIPTTTPEASTEETEDDSGTKTSEDGGDEPATTGSEGDLAKVAATLEGMLREHGEGDAPEKPPPLPMAYAAAGFLKDRHTGTVLSGPPLTVRASRPGAGALEAEVDNATGAFRFSGLAFGPYVLVAEAEGYLPCWSELAVPITGEHELFLERSCSVRIRVTDVHARRIKDVGFKIPGPKVQSIEDPFWPKELSTAQEGRYHVVKGLRPGKQQLQVEAEGFKGLLVEVLVERDEIRSYWVVLKK